jgi:DNA-binding MarR family transcriptional regulator
MKKLDFLKAALNETSDLKKGRARLLTSLEWIYRWRYTTPDIIKSLLQINNNHHYKLIAGWEEKGFIRKIKTAHLRFRNILIITNRGSEFLQAYSNAVIISPLIDKTKIRISGMQHCLAIQSFSLSMILPETEFETEHELRLSQKPGTKVPDFLVYDENKLKTAIEIELSAKSNEQTEIAFSHALEGLKENKFDNLIYASSSRAILRKYEKLSKKKEIGIWFRSQESKRWFASLEGAIDPIDFKEQISFRFDKVDYFKSFIG